MHVVTKLTDLKCDIIDVTVTQGMWSNLGCFKPSSKMIFQTTSDLCYFEYFTGNGFEMRWFGAKVNLPGLLDTVTKC